MKFKKKLRLLKQSFRIAGADKVISVYVFFLLAMALLLYFVEPTITSVTDSLWYCFAVATTVGFGDIAAVSHLGRILTVLLSLYSTAVLAILTAVITSFFLDTAKTRADDSIKAFLDDLEHLPELSEAELRGLSERIRRFRS